MRKSFAAVMLVSCLAGIAVPSMLLAGDDPGPRPRWTLRVFGGPNYQNLSDLNSGADGLTGLVMLLSPNLGAQEGQFGPAHWGFEVGADLVYELIPNFGVGIGTGFLRAARSSLITQTWQRPPYDVRQRYTIDPASSVVPLRAALYVFIPIGSFGRISLNAGPELEITSISLDVRTEFPDWSWEQHEKASGTTLALHAGLGLEKPLSSWATLFVEAQGRMGQVRNLKGSHHLFNTVGFDEAAEGSLYYWANSTYGVFHGNPHIPFPLIGVQANPPSGAHITDVRKASVNLSGGGLLAGLVVRF